MPRQLQKNDNGNLQFTELVWDDDEEDVDHPLNPSVQLDKRNGSKLQGPSRSPSWIGITINELGVNSNLERYEEEVVVTIQSPDDNLGTNTYTFLLKATDGKEEKERRVNLTVG